MNKVYTRIKWENEPSFNTPINEENLNAMDVAINELDDRVVELDTSKSNESEVLSLISDVSLDESTGTFTFTRKNGSTIKFDTKLEKIIVNFVFNHQTQTLDITLEDGTVQQVDLSALVTQYDFLDSDTIRCELKVENVYDESTFEHDIDYRNYGLPDVYYPNASEHIGKYYLDLSTGILYNSKLADWSETEYVWSTIRLQLTLLSSNYKVVFHVVDGSITEDKINPNYLAQIKVETQKSESYMNSANQSATSAENSALRAEEAAGKAEAVTGLTIDDALSETSFNPVQNKVITLSLDDKKIYETVEGSEFTLTDSAGAPLKDIVIYGNSTQSGTPTIENPIEIESVGDGGSIQVTCGNLDGNTEINTIPLDEPLHGIGNVKDELSISGGLIKRFKKAVFDGSADENWVLDRGNPSSYSFSLVVNDLGGNENIQSVSNIMCDRLSAISVYAITNGASYTQKIASDGATHKLYIRPDDAIMDADALKTFLSTSPITVIYELSEPIYEEIDQNTQLLLENIRTFDGTTTVSNSENTNITIEYYKNNGNGKSVGALKEELVDLKNSGGTGGTIAVDVELSETSKNPVQNKVITKELNKLEQDFSSSVSIKSETGENLIIIDAIDSPMLLNDWDKTLFEQEEYADGYNIFSYSDNLSVNPQNGTVASQFNNALVDDCIFLPNRTYEISFVGAVGHKVYANEEVFYGGANFECTGEKQTVLYKSKSTIPSYTSVAVFKNFTGNTVMPNFTDVKIRLVSTVTVKRDTESPVVMESYDGYTEIDAPSYVSVAYAVNDTGKNLLKYTDPTILKSESILSTLTECEASTNPTDIAGASALAEASDLIQGYWHKVGTVTGTTQFNIDLTRYNEVKIVYVAVSSSYTVVASNSFPTDILDDNTTKYYLIGGWNTGNSNVNMTKSYIKPATFMVDNTNLINNTTCHIYVR